MNDTSEDSLYHHDCLTFVPNELRFGVRDPDDFDHLPWLDSIWRQAPVEDCVAVDAFLDYHARVSHPFANPAVPDAFRPHLAFRFGASRFVLREENVEELTRELLALCFWDLQAPLGCVETGQGDGGEVCLLAALAKHAPKPVPANVAEELRAWCGACRRLTSRQVVLIDTPDRETAVRVRRLLGEQATLAGDTGVEWRGTQIRPDLRKKLADQGLFLETG